MKTLACLASLFAASGWLIAAPRISLVTDAEPGRATQHGLEQFRLALQAKGVPLETIARLDSASGDVLVAAGLSRGNGAAASVVSQLGSPPISQPESLLISMVERTEKPVLLVAGADDRGLMYALLDMADRIGWAADPNLPFSEVRDITEKPDVWERALTIYTMQRATFEQRFFDEAYWARYFDLLARDRFNTFLLVFGYENGGYFAPAYPYFFDVEGFPDVHVVDFTREQQERYLRALNRLIELAHDRGLQFKVGLWDHIYRGGVQAGGVTAADTTRALSGVPTGLATTNLMAYSTAALAKFLKVVPGVDGVQLRMHDESGLKPGQEQHDFWNAIFDVVKQLRPNLELNLRAKGLPDEIIRLGLDKGLKVRISTKYWAEQVGLPFHPTHIPRQDQMNRRHGYADLLSYPQRYKVNWGLWTGGTTRILLWGDPDYARRFAGSTHLYDGDGFEVIEPLATKMEAQPHDQKPFDLLRPQYRYYDYEFERYWHFFQVFGRVGYDPQTPPEVWDREFQRRFGADAASYVEQALHRASWILPRINASVFPYDKFPTTRGWVEKQRWGDLPAYARAEGSDTQQFQGLDEAARECLAGTESAKVSPAQNSAWLAQASRDVLAAVSEAERRSVPQTNKEFNSTIVDLKILANLALYHSRRIQAGFNYALFSRSQDVNALDAAIAYEHHAVDAWEKVVDSAGDIYADDLMMGLRSAGLSGHWRDELAALRKGLSSLEEQRRQFRPKTVTAPAIACVPIRKAAPDNDLVVHATIWGPEPIKTARLVWRTGTNDMTETAMESAGPIEYRATVPRSKLREGGSYSILAEDGAGRQAVFPAGGDTNGIRVIVTADQEAPVVAHTPIVTARPGQPLRITAQVRDPSGVKWVRLRYRGVTQYQDYSTLDLHATGRPNEYEAVVPGEQIGSKWDFMYFFEVMDGVGNGRIHPDLDRETPYVVVKLER